MNLCDNRGTVNDPASAPRRPLRRRIGETNCLGCLEGSQHHAIDCPRRDDEWRRQERVDNLGGDTAPTWDEAGTVDVRLLCGVAAVAALALAVWLLWPYLVGAGVAFAGWRVVTRHTRRRRPRSSWSSLGRTVALLYASWNSRGLVRRNGRELRVSVPASAGREHRDQYGDVPY